MEAADMHGGADLEAIKSQIWDVIGTGMGGATLERFHSSDLRPRANFPEAPESSLPEAWPIAWHELEPFYVTAERLYGVLVTSDPLAPGDSGELPAPPPLNGQDQNVYDQFVRRGLHPYRSHHRDVGTAQSPRVGCQWRLDAGEPCRPSPTKVSIEFDTAILTHRARCMVEDGIARQGTRPDGEDRVITMHPLARSFPDKGEPIGRRTAGGRHR